MSSPSVFLLVGSASVGKSTTARALAARFERSVHIPVDDLRHMVVGGMAWPSPEWGDELQRQVALARGAAVRMALDYAAAGFAVVIDDFYDPMGMREYRELLARPDTLGVVLHPAEEEARRRNAARGGGTPEPYVEMAITHAYGFLAPAIAGLAAGGWLVLDTTRLDAAATVEAILAGRPGAARSPGG
jgi:predicted kinase